MKGDFTRDTFRPEKHYQQVLMQQGRVQLDADWNEQAAIVAHRDAAMMADLVGGCGGPAGNAAFAIRTDSKLGGDFYLSAGRYYVDGILCEVEGEVQFSQQPHRRLTPGGTATLQPAKDTTAYLIYLDVWQRHVTAHEDPGLREPALGGPDTSTRVQTVWQVRAMAIRNWDQQDPCAAPEFNDLVRRVFPTLTARTAIPDAESDPCTVPASAGYRGLENHLYRVEIHKSGGLGRATFKWSRDNGSVVARILGPAEPVAAGNGSIRITLESIGRDGKATFSPQDIVEIVHESEEYEELVPALSGATATHGQLAEVTSAATDGGSLTLTPLDPDNPTPLVVRTADRPRLRKWDWFGEVPPARSPAGAFVALESGIEVRFEATSPAEFRTGDYWLIPARAAASDAASGRIEWPGSAEARESLRPKGVKHHYARLGIVSVDGKNQVVSVADCRCLWPALGSAPHPSASEVSTTDPAPVRIVGVDLPNGKRGAFGLDATITLQQLTEGIVIHCDRPLDESTLADDITRGQPTCYVTIELPTTANVLHAAGPVGPIFAPEVAGYTPLVLAAKVEVNNSTSDPERPGQIGWTPADALVPWLNRFFDSVAGNPAVTTLGRLLLRLTVTGNFVWSNEAEARFRERIPGGFLDGEVRRAPPSSPYGLVLPTGDRLPGGNFEMWFWLEIPQHAPSPSIEVFPSSVHFGHLKVGQRDDIAVIVTNKGGALLTIRSMGEPNELFQLSSIHRLPIGLTPAQSIKLVASFTAESHASGALSREFVIESDAGPATVMLSANVET